MTSSSSSPDSAPARLLPSTVFYSIEYPGYVKSTSVPNAIQNLGGQSTIDTVFKRSATKAEALVELSLRPQNPFAHPVPGDVVGVNHILLKVVKRRRKNPTEEGLIGEYTAEAVGVVPKTVRFRGE